MNRVWQKSYPEDTPFEVEIPLMSLYEILDHSAQQYPSTIAVIVGERELSYFELKSEVDRFAGSLYTWGFKKEDRIALMLPNCIEYIIAYYAIHRLGDVVVQVNPMYKTNELDYILRDSNATWLIGFDEQKNKIVQTGLADGLTIISANKIQEDRYYSLIAEGDMKLTS